MHLERPTYLGTTTFRRDHIRFGIRQSDKLLHSVVIGATGVGKSSLLRQMVRQELYGWTLLDPHGDLADQLRQDLGPRAIYWNPADPDCPYGYNPLRRVRTDKIPLAASGLMEAFKKLWGDAWGIRMEHILRNCLYALLERDGSTLPDILKLGRDAAFRREVAAQIKNPIVRTFWQKEFPSLPPRYAAEAFAPIQSRLGACLSDPTLYRTLVSPKEPLSFRQIMDGGQTLIVNLSRGVLGSDSSETLGSLLIATLGLAAMSRLEVPEADRVQHQVYVDEFHTFTTAAFANMLTELRKAKVGMTLASQSLTGVLPEVRHAILANVGTLICFRVGVEDAALFAKELAPAFEPLDLISLPNHHFYIRLMIDGVPSGAFSAELMSSRQDRDNSRHCAY
jgi:hypothetical protein